MKWCNRNTRRIDAILDKALEWNSESYTVWLWFTKLGITIHASAINPDIGASLFGVNKGCRRQFENTCESPKQKVVLYKQYQQVTKQFLPAQRAVLRLPTAALDDQAVIPEMATHESSFMKWHCKWNSWQGEPLLLQYAYNHSYNVTSTSKSVCMSVYS